MSQQHTTKSDTGRATDYTVGSGNVYADVGLDRPEERLAAARKQPPKDFIVADSGAREASASGMVRDVRVDKGRFDLISPIALNRLAKVYERGAAKYADRNWEKGRELSRFLDSATRHLNDYQMIATYRREGISLEQLPPDVNPNEDHLSQAVWNIFAMLHLETTKPELDDLNYKTA